MTTYATPTTETDWTEVARNVGSRIQKGVAERDRTGEISFEAFELLKEAGVTSALVPRDSGGGGASHAEMGEILRELGRVDASTALTLSMHSHIVATQLWRHKHGQDAEKLFRKVADHRAITISTGASDWVGSNGTARRVEGGYRVDGRKTPVSGCEVGDVLVTSFRWEDAPEGPQVIHCSLPFAADGVSIDPTWDTLGLRATGSHTVVLEDVFVPDEAVSLIRPADQWHPFWSAVLGSAMPLIMSVYLGLADAAIKLGTLGARGRTDPHILQLLGEMMNAHTRAEDAIAGMFRDSDNLQFASTDSHASRTLSRKTAAAEAVIETVRLAIEVTGGFGYSRNSELERLYRDVHGCLFHPLPRAKQTQFTGRAAMGLSPVA